MLVKVPAAINLLPLQVAVGIFFLSFRLSYQLLQTFKNVRIFNIDMIIFVFSCDVFCLISIITIFF